MINWRRGTAPVVLLALMAASAEAHPHVWIEMRSDVVLNEQGLIKAINVEWTFDDGYAQAAIEGLDTNGDGDYSQTELDPLTKENMQSLKDYEFFTYPRVEGKKVPIGEITEYGQIYSNSKLTLHFVVPLKEPVDPKTKDFYYKIYDPDFFIAMDYALDQPVNVIGNLPQGCKLDMKPVPTDAELEQTRQYLATKGQDWQPAEDEEFGGMFAQPIHIACAG
jgi:ABC-type uncharacterized transport system substrate-binding protein